MLLDVPETPVFRGLRPGPANHLLQEINVAAVYSEMG